MCVSMLRSGIHKKQELPEYYCNSVIGQRRKDGKVGATDGRVVRARLSVTWNVLLWSGGHEFEPWWGRIWVALYFCPHSVLLEQNIRLLETL